MTSFESNNSNFVEVDGIRFEAVIYPKILTTPEPKSRCFTPLEVGIRITNNTQTFLYFSTFYNCFVPEIILPDGKLIGSGTHSERLSVPTASNFEVLIPGKGVTLYCDSFLYWMGKWKKKHYRELTLDIPFPTQDVYVFCFLYPGRYQLRINYRQSPEIFEFLYRQNEPTFMQRIAENLWIGEVYTPFIEFSLV